MNSDSGVFLFEQAYVKLSGESVRAGHCARTEGYRRPFFEKETPAFRKRYFAITVGAAACVLAAAPAPARAPSRMSVQVRSAPLRAAPSFLAAAGSELAYGDRVSVVESRPGWVRVTHAEGARQGWLHESALTPKRIVLQAADDAAITADSREVALAGKGFNQQVENELRQRRPNLDFTWVDRMEKMRVAPEQLRRFQTAGMREDAP